MLSDAARSALRDIAAHAELALEFTHGLTEEGFIADKRTLLAVTRCLEIISEASRRLPDALKARHPQIEWRNMAAAGNIYRHEYEGVAVVQVWEAARYALPPLQAVMAAEIAADIAG